MFRNPEKINLLSLLLSYFLLFGLINIEHYNFSFKYLISDNFFDKIKFFRSLIPFFIIAQFVFNKFILKINLKINLIISLLFCYTFFQFIGILFSNENPIFNIFYLLLYFSTLLVFYQIINLKFTQLKYFKFLLILVLLILFLTFFSNNLILFFTTEFSFYVEYPPVFRSDLNPSLLDPSLNINIENNSIYRSVLGEAPPRSSGISRIALIISLFFLVLFDKKKKYNFLIYLLIFYLNFSVFLTFSKINTFSLIFLTLVVIYFSEINSKIKFFRFFIVLVLPLIFTIFLINAKNNNLFPFQNIPTKYVEKKTFEQREIATRSEHLFTLTGREIIWRDIINKTKNKWLSGNGPQADRYLIGQSASNLLFYSYSAGGIFSILIFLFLYGYFLKRLIWLVYRKKLKSIKNNLITYSSLLILLYMFMRSIFESSFGVFGIDLIIFLTTFLIFDKHHNQ